MISAKENQLKYPRLHIKRDETHLQSGNIKNDYT